MTTLSPDAPVRPDPRLASAMFPAPYEAIRPFFQTCTQWGAGGDQTHLAFRTLKDHFPELSSQEVFVIIVTAQRMFGHGHDTV